jgi:hypothetical protein
MSLLKDFKFTISKYFFKNPSKQQKTYPTIIQLLNKVIHHIEIFQTIGPAIVLLVNWKSFDP